MKKQITKKHPEGFVRINISTDGTNENNPYFSITADLCADSTFRGSKIHSCGCLHDEILSICPELKPFVDIHLSTLDGVPMHAEENGWYWLAKAAGIPRKYEPEQSELDCFAFFMSHARMSGDETLELVKKLKTAKNPREVWQKQLDGLRPRWQDEATKAIALLESL